MEGRRQFVDSYCVCMHRIESVFACLRTTWHACTTFTLLFFHVLSLYCKFSELNILLSTYISISKVSIILPTMSTSGSHTRKPVLSTFTIIAVMFLCTGEISIPRNILYYYVTVFQNYTIILITYLRMNSNLKPLFGGMIQFIKFQ